MRGVSTQGPFDSLGDDGIGPSRRAYHFVLNRCRRRGFQLAPEPNFINVFGNALYRSHVSSETHTARRNMESGTRQGSA